jgi:sugar lactone lactonase YvrE
MAGNGTEPWRFNGDNGPATSALLSGPGGVAVDAAGNVYFTDSFRVRKVSNGVITTVAGTGEEGGDNVPATSAELYGLRGIAVSSAGDLYIADGLSHLSAMEYSNVNNRIRKVSKAVITTVAGKADTGYSGDNGPANLAQLDSPVGVAVDSAGNLYIADSQNNRIRKVSNGVITTVAGNGESGFSGDGGPATRARLFKPTGVAVDPAGNLYIADTANSRVRKVSRGVITTVAGNGTIGFSGDGGPATSAQLIRPNGLAVDSAGKIYIVDEVHRIREISNGVITTVAGNGTPGFSGDNGPAATAQLYWPSGLAVDSAGKIYVAEIGNERIRLLTPASSSCSASVTPTTLSSRASGGNLIVSIKTTSASCAWAVQSLPSWITYSGNVVGTGSASVELLVAKNRGASRRATVSIAGIPVTITQ